MKTPLILLILMSGLFFSAAIISCEPVLDDPEVTEQTGELGFSEDNTVGACGNYEGYTGDIQYSTQCKMAQMYTCEGYQPGITAACDIIDGFRDDNPDLPACPYCN